MGACCAKAERKGKIKPSTSFWDKTNTNETQRHYASSTEDITFFYTFGNTLGKNKYGIIKEAKRKGEENKSYAIKIMPRHQYEQNIRNEIENLMKLDHPSICKFIETYIDNQNVYLVMEFLKGGSLESHQIQTKGEAFIAKIIYTIACALQHMHVNNLVHRNICLKNILFTDETLEEVKIINLSNSCAYQIFLLDEDSKKKQKIQKLARTLTKKVGSDGFTAPEVILTSKYDNSCDIWSLGVVAYCLLCGEMPFGNDDAAIQGEVKFEGKGWRNISKAAKITIENMLSPNPKNRITIKKLLNEQWFGLLNSKQLSGKALEYNMEELVAETSVRNYCCANKFKQTCLKLLVKRADDEKLKVARSAFEKIDKDKNGEISKDELKKLIDDQNYFKNSPKNNLNSLLKYFFQTSEIIKYTEFLAATLQEDQYSESSIKSLFQYLDTDSNGYLDFADLEDIMAREGTKISEEEAKAIMEEYTQFLKEGKLYFEDFYTLMIKEQTKLKENLSLKANEQNAEKSLGKFEYGNGEEYSPHSASKKQIWIGRHDGKIAAKMMRFDG